MPASDYAIQDGRAVESRDAVIPALSSAASYGDGCFETFRSYSGRFIAFDRHIARLLSGMNYLGMDIPAGFSQRYFEEETARLLKMNRLELTDARVRLQVWRLGPLGYKPGKSDAVSFLLTASPVGNDQNTVRLASVDPVRIPSAALRSRHKLSNGINYILARREAEAKGCDDALMTDQRGNVSETTIANVFWKKGDEIFTPSESCDLLPGITRGLMLHWLDEQNDISVRTGEFDPGLLKQAETVWLTNSVQEITGVSGIDGISFNTEDPFLKKLQNAYRGLVGHA